MPFDDDLESFTALTEPWSGILIGNGASQVVSQRFRYASLFDRAASTAVAHALTDPDKQIFNQLGTKNFEQVLWGLRTARIVAQAFGNDHAHIDAAYDRIRTSLVEAVHSVHIPWASVPAATLQAIRAALLKYDYVYSTNYDLLLYWAIMQDPSGFKDWFFGPIFDIGNTEIWDKATKVLFLHGALHLYRTNEGRTYKRAAGEFGNLLQDFGTPIPDSPEAVPLFVTEGTSADKLRSIFTSDYLSFAYTSLSRHDGPIVIFGQSLEEQFDKHIIDAIRGSRPRVVGIGIYPATATAERPIRAIKAEWQGKLPPFDLRFFDSTTHPLGDPAFAVP
jgi:hypothetical protein